MDSHTNNGLIPAAMLKALGGLETGQQIILSEVRDLRRESRLLGERLSRLEATRQPGCAPEWWYRKELWVAVVTIMVGLQLLPPWLAEALKTASGR